MHIWTQPHKGVTGDPRRVTSHPQQTPHQLSMLEATEQHTFTVWGKSNHSPQLTSAACKGEIKACSDIQTLPTAPLDTHRKNVKKRHFGGKGCGCELGGAVLRKRVLSVYSDADSGSRCRHVVTSYSPWPGSAGLR